MTIDAKSVATIIAALGLAYSQIHQNSTIRADVGAGVVGYVSDEMQARDRRIDALQMEVETLLREKQAASVR